MFVVLCDPGCSPSGFNRGAETDSQTERTEGARATVVGAADQAYATGGESTRPRRR